MSFFPKYVFSFSSILLFFFFLLGPIQVMGQEEEAKKVDSSWVDTISGQSNPTPKPEVTPETTIDVSKLTPEQKAVLAEQLKLQDAANDSEMAELDRLIKEKGARSLITDPAMAKKVVKALSKNKGKNAKPLSPFAAVPEAQIEALIFKQAEGTPAFDFFKSHPKFVTFIVRFFKSEEAFFGLIKIASQEKKLKLYAGTFVLLTLLSFLFNMMGSRKAAFWKRLVRKIILSILITFLQFVSLYLFFGEELQPTINIAKQVFFP
ncbi:MAG: hypothetical protein ACOYL6_11515 [Bacteriovoracaceae bacterium]